MAHCCTDGRLITLLQTALESLDVDANTQSVNEAIVEHDRRSQSIAAYRPNVERVKQSVKVGALIIDGL
jgi:hypothetical protein